MDHLQRFINQVRERLFVLLFVNNLLFLADYYVVEHVFHLEGWTILAALAIVPLLSISFLPWLSTNYLVQPTRLIWQAILHIAPDAGEVPAPDLKKARLGRELVTSLVTHVYQIANVVESLERTTKTTIPDLRADFIANNLPLPLIVLDKADNIIFANAAAQSYISKTLDELKGNNVYTMLDMSFTSEATFSRWLQQSKSSKVTNQSSWERVRLNLPDQKTIRYFDLAAYYNRNNLQGTETILVLFDRTRAYSQDEQAMSFVALAVHELRTPLTLLRGYIEVFDEELTDKVDPELAGYIQKMKVAAQNLTAFTNNILNVSRYENDQLTLKLQEEDWGRILQAAVDDLTLRAQVQGISLKTEVAASLPTVGADRVGMYEVVANLIDNAIKYSGEGKEITVRAVLNKDGLVETTVTDIGVGIQQSALANLFDKFYRNHRNRSQVGGTGMGLYIAKAIVEAHDGTLWVSSKEGAGSTFGFTLLPYAKLAEEQKNSDNTGITRSAHGWIKNHSMYRR